MSTPKTKKEPQTFESASERLDELIEAMENGNLPLDEMIAAFEEGRKLVAFCNAKLKEVEKRVELIKSSENDDSVQRELFQ